MRTKISTLKKYKPNMYLKFQLSYIEFLKKFIIYLIRYLFSYNQLICVISYTATQLSNKAKGSICHIQGFFFYNFGESSLGFTKLTGEPQLAM